IYAYYFFFFSSRRRHTRFSRDWSSTCALPILKNNPYFFSSILSSSLTTPGCTTTQRSSGFISKIFLKFLERSTTIPFPTTCPANDVPAVRGMTGKRSLEAKVITLRTSSHDLGTQTAVGISL